MIMKLKNMKFFIKRKRKLMNSWRNLMKKRLLMKVKFQLIKLLLLLYSNICKRIWLDKISFQQLLNTKIKRMIWHLSKVNLKMLKTLWLGLRLNLSKDKMILKRLRLLKEELKKKCSKSLRKSRKWKMKWPINLLKLMISRSCLIKRKLDQQQLKLSFNNIRLVFRNK